MHFDIRQEVKPHIYGDNVSATKLEPELEKIETAIMDLQNCSINLTSNLKNLAVACRELAKLVNDTNNEHVALIQSLKHDVDIMKCRLGLVEDNNYGQDNTEDNTDNS